MENRWISNRWISNRWIQISAILLIVTSLSAQTVETASAFLDTVPLGARVYLDGKVTDLRTPVLLRGLTKGTHAVSLWKSGYLQSTQNFVVEEGKTAVLKVNLLPESVVLSFPANDEVTSPTGPLAAVGQQFRYPSGNYYLSATMDTVRVMPVFEDADLLDTAGWALTLAGAGASAAGGLDAWAWRNGGPARPSATTVALATATVGEFLWYLSLQTRKAEFYRETAASLAPLPQRFDHAITLSREGDSALETGDLAAAEQAFRRLVREFPDSGWVPSAWFRLAKIHSLTGRQDLALGEYRLVAEVYPQATYHDRARQALADLYEAGDRPDLALYHLDRMVLTDGYFDQGTVLAQRKRLEKATVPGTAVAMTEATTPRQSYDRVVELFGQGHAFTASELTTFPALQDRLSERGDDELASDLDLIRVASAAADPQVATTGEDRASWEQREALRNDRLSWRGVRNTGLMAFHLSAATAVFAASMYDNNGSQAALWTAGGALAAFSLSLFPILWAEPRQ